MYGNHDYTTPEPRHMDANEMAARTQFANALARSHPVDYEDATVRAVVAEAEAENRWNREHHWVEEPELRRLFDVSGFQDDFIRKLQVLGLAGFGVRILPRGGPGGQDKAELLIERTKLAGWLELFDTAAQQLGYQRTAQAPTLATYTRARALPTYTPDGRAVRMVGVVTAALLFGILA